MVVFGLLEPYRGRCGREWGSETGPMTVGAGRGTDEENGSATHGRKPSQFPPSVGDPPFPQPSAAGVASRARGIARGNSRGVSGGQKTPTMSIWPANCSTKSGGVGGHRLEKAGARIGARHALCGACRPLPSGFASAAGLSVRGATHRCPAAPLRDARVAKRRGGAVAPRFRLQKRAAAPPDPAARYTRSRARRCTGGRA